MQKLDTPGAISAADISSAPSADGAIFYSYQQKTSGLPVQAVYRRAPDGSGAPVPIERRVTGRGQLSVEGGALVLTAWDEAAIPKVAWRIEVPGYVPFASAPGGGPVAAEDAERVAPFGSEAWPNYGMQYTSEALLGDGRWYLRANKIVALLTQLAKAVAQLQRLAKKAGWLE